ncbi:MAG: 3'-5' exonuclease [Burkholderiales bacterium]|nr:3'-5' exonuclease [Burkholderiales bacterium]
MTPILAFDIETIPDIAGLRALHGLDASLTDRDVAEFAFARRRAQTGSDFLPLHLHRVVAIACALRNDEGLRVWSLGSAGEDEGSLVQRFFDGIEKYTPQLVSWNGGGFDLPVLHYRSLAHGLAAPKYWDLGEDEREFRFNNYITRYHMRHLDLMDLLAMYQPRASAPLDEIAKLCGFPGKLGMDGAAVWGAWLCGGIDRIRRYCETDAANTYLVFLRFQRLRGVLDPARYRLEIELARDTLCRSGEPHWGEFLDAWRESPGSPAA